MSKRKGNPQSVASFEELAKVDTESTQEVAEANGQAVGEVDIGRPIELGSEEIPTEPIGKPTSIEEMTLDELGPMQESLAGSFDRVTHGFTLPNADARALAGELMEVQVSLYKVDLRYLELCKSEFATALTQAIGEVVARYRPDAYRIVWMKVEQGDLTTYSVVVNDEGKGTRTGGGNGGGSKMLWGNGNATLASKTLWEQESVAIPQEEVAKLAGTIKAGAYGRAIESLRGKGYFSGWVEVQGVAPIVAPAEEVATDTVS